MSTDNPEIAHSIRTGALDTNYHDRGTGRPVLLLHGSGPGVSAWANWRLVLEGLNDRCRLLAPDLAGFGYTTVPADYRFSREAWLEQIVAFLDQIGVDQVDLVGNSFGGSMALALTIAHPQRVRRLVLMGSVGVPFELTPGLDAVWGYTPSLEHMRELMGIFAYDQSRITEELVALRHAASARPGVHEAYARMFPAPRQRWVDAMAHKEAEVRGITQPTLMVHGREDKVIPLQTSQTLLDWIHNSQLHVFGRCGHWTQIEHAATFQRLLVDFFTAD